MRRITTCIYVLVTTITLCELGARFFIIDYLTAKESNNKIKNKLMNFDHHPAFKFKKYSLKYPHPYWGYIENNFKRSIMFGESGIGKRVIKIGIFGGSVADGFCSDIINLNIKKKYFLEKFNKYDGVKVICYSAGGYRQPQALNITSILMPEIDIAINIEGSNELEYDFDGRYPHYYPMHPISNLYYRHTHEVNWTINLTSKLNKIYDVKEKIKKKYNFKFIKAVYLFKLNLLKRSFLNGYNDLQNEMNKDRRVENIVSLEEKMKFWLKMSCQQSNLLFNRKIKSYFFMQPLPYIKGAKILTKTEKSYLGKYIGKQGSNRMKRILSIPGIYKKIDKLGPTLMGLSLSNLQNIFSNTKEAVYTDGCCHLNNYGNEIMLKAILKQINDKDKPRLCDIKAIRG